MAANVTTGTGRRAVLEEPVITAPSGLWSWVTTVDHKRIGIMYLVLSMVFFFIGGLEAILIRVQLARPNNDFVSAETYNQLFTMHGTTMIFLAIMPMSAAFFNFLVPLMIGARDVAFPRLNAFSWWLLLFGAILINLGWLHGQAPDAGWFSYANLTSSAYSPDNSVNYWIIGIQVLGLSSMASAINFLITIINMRAPGMTMMRLPVFIWMTAIVAVLLILALPPLTIGVTLLMLDRFYDANFFIPEAGGSPLLWQHLFWVFGHPEVYILILPAFGIVSEVLPVFSRKPLFGYSAIVFSGIGIAFLGFGVWAHHMFTVGMGPVPNSVFAISTMLIALPTGIKIFNWIFTMWGGHLNFKTPLLFAIGLVSMFLIGGLSGVMHASPPVDSQHQDSYFVVAHFHYVLFGGSIMGLFAGIYYWFPKITGKMFSDGLGKLHFWLMLIGFNVTFFPMHWVGVQGMPRRIYTYEADQGWNLWNMVETLGTFVLALGFIVFIVNVYMSLTFGDDAPADPWDGSSLEWAIPSPPPVHNFDTIPAVTSRIPLWTAKYPDVYGGDGHGVVEPPLGHEHEREHRLSGTGAESHEHSAEDIADLHAHGHDAIHLPNPSYWPLVAAFGISLAFGGFLFSFEGLEAFLRDDLGVPLWYFGNVVRNLLIYAGIVIGVVGVYGWVLEPAFGHGDVAPPPQAPLQAAHAGD